MRLYLLALILTVPANWTLAQRAGMPKEPLRPVTERDAYRAAVQLWQASNRLNSYLNRQGANGRAWKTYLRWNDLKQQLGAQQPDLAVMSRVLERYQRGQPGFEKKVFSDVEQSLERYIEVARLANDPAAQTDLSKQVANLSDRLSQYRRQPAASDALAIGRILGRLEATGQARDLVQSVRRQNSFPNLYVGVSEDVVTAGFAEGVNDVGPVREMILGTNVKGTAWTTGRTYADVVPSHDTAIIDLLFCGTVRSKTVGRNGPATIRSRGTTQLFGRKRIFLDELWLTSAPGTSSAQTRTTTESVSVDAKLFKRLVQRIASQRVSESKPQAERIASGRAEQRLSDRLDRQATPALARANRDLTTRLRNPLLRADIYPQRLQFSSDSDSLSLVALEAGPTQLAAPTRPPRAPGRGKISVQVHESMLNNLTGELFAGRTLTEEELNATPKDLLGKLPEELSSGPEQEPWSITFAEEQPMAFAFRRDGFQVTIFGRRFTSGERNFAAMNITADYKFEADQRGGLKAVRQGELQIYPPDFDPEGEETLSIRQQSLRRLLERRFGNIFRPEIVPEGFYLPGRWRRAGQLVLSAADAQSGWLSLAWNRPRSASSNLARR